MILSSIQNDSESAGMCALKKLTVLLEIFEKNRKTNQPATKKPKYYNIVHIKTEKKELHFCIVFPLAQKTQKQIFSGKQKSQ